VKKSRSNSEHQRPSEILARRVKEARKGRGWSQEQLADEATKRYGYPLARSTVAKIEQGGTRADARLGDLLALAAALEVPPVHLLTPDVDEAPVAVTPNTIVPAGLARAWIRGQAMLPGAGVNLSQIPASELRQLVEREFTRGMSPLARSLGLSDPAKKMVDAIVDEIRNPKEDDDG
jgi:transcriptional regulator with XRE-family HTH domain